ncbi:MAG: L-threonylcarbamoyladenylate synthase [Bacteroidetes bacterium]|nr:L-threonylcarbamoyladenylate synthase [Bacteroidota bacterium]
MNNKKLFEPDIKKCLKGLVNGGVILYPTDTIWGIGCDATSPVAVERIISIKKRHPEKGFIILVNGWKMLSEYVSQIPETVREFTTEHKRPLTVVYPLVRGFAANAISSDGSAGIRIVKDSFCRSLLRQFRKPIISTSANESGKPFPRNFSEINRRIIKKCDYAVKFRQEETFVNFPSDIIRFDEEKKAIFIRKTP